MLVEKDDVPKAVVTWIDLGNANFARLGISSHCKLIEGDAHNMPLPEG